jgi:hypothetical protein
MRRVDSTVKRWPGYIELPDFLTLPQLIVWNDAFQLARQYTGEGPGPGQRIVTDLPRYNHAMLSAACAIVAGWNLDGLGELKADTFPATPLRPAQALQRFIVDAVADLIRIDDEDTVPNG